MATPIPPNDPNARLPDVNAGGIAAAQCDRIGMKLGKYVLGRVIGRGGMGTVYEAEDSFLKRKVAIKVLPDSLATNGKAIRRFVLEARSFARVNHPNAVQIYEVDRRHEVCYLVMELMRGGSVQELLQAQGAMDWPEATQAVSDACRALAATHAAGLVHRDIKPGNLMRSADGVVKLADFGLAKDTESAQRSLTMPGGVVGTPSYMSPEQCRSEPVDARTDIYALGATYYTLLTGRPPYESELPLQVLFAHCSASVPDPRDVVPGVPGACVAIISRAMAKEPRDRYQTAGEMLADLEAALSAGARSVIGDLGDGQTDAVLADLALAVSEPKAELESNMPSAGVLAAPSMDRASADITAPPVSSSMRWPVSLGRWTNRWTMWCALLATVAVVLTMGVRNWGLLEVFGFESKRSSESTGPGDAATTKASAPATTRTKPATRLSRVYTKYFGGVPAEGAMLESGDNVVALAFSNDGGRLAIGRSGTGRAGGVKVYDTQSGKLVPAFYENRAVHALCFSPTGQKLAAAGDAGVIVRDGDLGWELSPPGGATVGPAWAITFSPDGKWLAALTGADRKNR